MKQLYITLLILLSISTNAQYVDIEYTLFDSSNGFVDDEISALYTDSNGTIWIGTYNNGIYTYANEEFTHYDEDENDFLTGRPSVFLEADNGDMWIGFYHEAYGGVMKFDGTNFITEHTVSDQISIGRVVDLLINEEGNLCILECHNSYHPHTLNIVEQDTILSYYMGETEENPRGIGNMVQTSDERIWIIGRPELYIYDDGEVLGDSLLNVPFETFDATHLELDDEGNIWFARWNENLIITDDQTNFWTFFDLESGAQDHQEVIPGQYVVTLFEDNSENIWFISKTNTGANMHLSRFDNGRLVNYHFTSTNVSYETPFNINPDSAFSNAITEDNEQNLWIGLENLGLVRLENVAPEDIPEVEELPELTEILPVDLSNTQLMENTYGQYIRYNEENGFVNLKVTALFYDSQERLWIAGGGGRIYSFKNDTFTRYPFFSNDWYDYNQFNGYYLEFTDFVEDSEGNIYIAVADEHLGGVYRFDGEKISSLYVNGNESLAYRYTSSLLMGEDNTLYAATWARNLDWGEDYPEIFDSSITIFESDTTKVIKDLGAKKIWDIQFHPDPTINIGFLGEFYQELDMEDNLFIKEFEDLPYSDKLRALAYNVGEYEILIADNEAGLRIYNETDDWFVYDYYWTNGIDNIYSAQNKTWCSTSGKIYSFENDTLSAVGNNSYGFYSALAVSDESTLWIGTDNGIKKTFLDSEGGTAIHGISTKSDLVVYPNPVSNQLYIDTPSNDVYQYHLYNNLGVLVQEGVLTNNRVDMSALNTGIYLLVLYSKHDCKHIRLIKK